MERAVLAQSYSGLLSILRFSMGEDNGAAEPDGGLVRGVAVVL